MKTIKLLSVLLVLSLAGCSEVKKQIEPVAQNDVMTTSFTVSPTNKYVHNTTGDTVWAYQWDGTQAGFTTIVSWATGLGLDASHFSYGTCIAGEFWFYNCNQSCNPNQYIYYNLTYGVWIAINANRFEAYHDPI